jgi:hypothetical protein
VSGVRIEKLFNLNAMAPDIKNFEDGIDQAAELLKSAYSNLITQSNMNDYVFNKIDDKKVVQNLRTIVSMSRRLEQEIREFTEGDEADTK